MNNGSAKKLPSKPKILDGLQSSLSIPEIQNELRLKPQQKTKVKLKYFTFVSFFVFSFAFFFVSTAQIKTERARKITRTVVPKRDVLRPLPALPKTPQDLAQINNQEINTPETYYDASNEPDMTTDVHYEPYEESNSGSAHDPYVDEVGRYLANEEEQIL